MIVDQKQMHLRIAPGDVGRYCILPGDPGRCATIAAYLDDAQQVAYNREFCIYTGRLDDEPVSVCSTGIGGPSTAIAVEELFACGCDTFVRMGTCGGIATQVIGGDAVIATGAVRQEGTSCEYMPLSYPAVSDFFVTQALLDSARALGLRHHVGVVQSKDSFYGQHAPHRMPVSGQLLAQWEAYKRGGVLASEMEGSTLFVVAAVLGARAGAVFHAIWNQERAAAGLDNPHNHDIDPVVRAAVEGIRRLIATDRATAQ